MTAEDLLLVPVEKGNILETFKISKESTREELVSLLQHQNATRYFKFNLEQYCELHKEIIEKTEDLTELIAFLQCDTTFEKALREREQFSSYFMVIVLPSLVEKCQTFKEEPLFEVVSLIIAKCIFSSKEFSCYLTDHFESKKCPEKHSLCKALFKCCVSLYSTSSIGLKLIFYSFSKSSKNFNDVYKMLVVLLEITGFELKGHFNFSKIKYQVPEPLLNTSLSNINELLIIVRQLKVHLENKINDITFSDFIKNLLKSVIALTKVPNSTCYDIFLNVIEINPLIIESNISESLVYIMLNDNTSCKEKYEELMIKILQVFSKLHRIQNLVAKMVPSLKGALEDRTENEPVYTFRGDTDILPTKIEFQVDNILPKVILECFTSCIVNLASWQVINLFKTLLFHIEKAVEELPEDKGENVYIEILSKLISWYLLSVRMAEHTVAETTVKKFVSCLEELKGILARFGTTLLQKEHNHVLMRAFLNISFYWAEMYMTLEYYSSNPELKMEKNSDRSVSPCSITYLHPYLSEKEWSLIAERINNFGKQPCKEIKQKLMIQKLRACLIFKADNIEEVAFSLVRTLLLDFDAESTEIFLDEFVVNNVLNKMPSNVIISLAEVIVKDLLEGDTKILDRAHIFDSELLIKGVLCVVFTKLNKLLKQKRKHDDAAIRKALFSRAVSSLPAEIFLAAEIEPFFGNVKELLSEEAEAASIDLKMHTTKIDAYLNILTKVPIIFCPESQQKLTILLLMALHRDLHYNCENDLKRKSETLILSITQHNKFTLLDLFEPAQFVKTLLDFFERGEDLFSQVTQNVFRTDQYISSFEPAITFIKDNLKKDKCLKLAVITLALLNKTKKNKISAESKEICAKYRSDICAKLTKRILKSKPEESLIEAYALVLKTYLAKDENDTLCNLTSCLNEYLEYCLNTVDATNIKGCLLLFITILHNKTAISEFNNEFILKIWNAVKTVPLHNDTLEDYSQLVMLITTLIPNEQCSNIFSDLLTITANSIDSSHDKEFSKHVKTWSCILSTNFNPLKTNILREQLESLLAKLLPVLKLTGSKQELFEEVIQLEISIIQANHVPLTASIMDFLLLSVSTVTMRDSHDFVRCFNLNISLLESLLKYRKPLIMDRLPPYLLQYRLLLKQLCLNSSSSKALQENEVQSIADCAHKLEKLTKNLVECRRDMSRIAMYLVADILGQYELDSLYPNVKKHLNNCVYSLISLCDQHAVQYLMRVLSNASTELFKFMYENYKRFYRFTGKV